MPGVEQICAGDELVAILVRGEYSPPATEFLTRPELNLQLGLIRYPSAGIIEPHVHRPLERHIVGTQEVLWVRSGQVEVSLFDSRRRQFATRVLNAGDAIMLVNGGHSFRMLEDSVLLEVKQGPYVGLDEKERFQP